MHIVYFQGGFANQLFQLCLYENLKRRYGDENIFADISRYKKNSDHGGFRLGRVYEFQYIKILPNQYIEIDEKNYEEINATGDENYFYKGYWQDEKYFPEDLNFVRNVVNASKLKGKKKVLFNLIKSKTAISVHVRRGDYVDHYLHGNIANETYYINAINYLKENVKDSCFFVFSDDINWCKKNIVVDGADIYYVNGSSRHVEEDMALMSICKHNIISNSSFSWWGQKLNNNEEKIVISPEYWLNDANENVNLNNGFIHVRNVPNVYEDVISPKFSFIIPVYNREISLKRCLSSILNQQYNNIEVVLIDDASTDNSVEIIKNYKEKDSRIILIQNSQNEGPLASRIRGMKEAKGEYILFVDSDDYVSDAMCNVLSENIDKYKVDIIEFRYITQPSGRIVENHISFNDMLPCVLDRKYPHIMWNKCYSKDIVERFLEKAESYFCMMAEDVYFTLLFIKLAKSYKRINNVLYHYVMIDGITSNKRISITEINKMIESIKNRDEALKTFFIKQKDDYNAEIRNGTNKDLAWIADFCMKLPQPIGERLDLINRIDSAFDTSLEKDYENKIEDSIILYNALNKGTKKDRIKRYIKTGVRLFK